MRPSSSKIFIGIAIGVLLSLVGAALRWPAAEQPLRVTKDAFDQIELGMSRPRVEEILGGPPGLQGEPLSHGTGGFFRDGELWRVVNLDADDAEMRFLNLDKRRDLGADVWIGSEPQTYQELRTSPTQPEDERGKYGRAIYAIRLKFDDNGNVVDKRYYKSNGYRLPTMFEKWRAWMKEKLSL